MTWFLAYLPYALTHGAALFHTHLIDYPVGVNLADNTSVPVLGLLGWPVTAALGPVATFNLLLRLSFAVSGMSMFLVARRWSASWQGPFLAGILYAFGPYMTSQELHLDLAFVPIPPLLILLGDELVRRRRMNPLLLGSLIGLAAAFQFLVSPDVLSGCVVLGLVIGAVLAYRSRAELSTVLPYITRVALVAVGFFALVCGYPIFEMLFGPGHLSGPVISATMLQHNSADLLGPIAPTSNELLAPESVAHLGNELVGTNISENGTFLGIPLLVFLIASYRRLRDDALIAACAGGAAAAFVLSLGANLVIGTKRLPIPLPGIILAHTPLFDNTIPARYGLYVAAFVAVIVAVAVDRVWLPVLKGCPAPPPAGRRLPRPAAFFARLWAKILPNRPRARLAGAGGLIVLSLLPAVPFASSVLPWPASLPARLAALAASHGPHMGTMVVTTDPVTSPSDARAMAWQAIAGMSFSIVGGYANVDVPGQAYGQRLPIPVPPPVLEGAPELIRQAARFDRPSFARANVLFTAYEQRSLCAYLRNDRISALLAASEVQVYPVPPPTSRVVTAENLPAAGQRLPAGDDSYSTVSFLISVLGQPRYVGPGYSIWLTAGRCSGQQT